MTAMTAKDQLKAAIDDLDEADVDELYALVKPFLQTKGHPENAAHRAEPPASGLCGIWQDEHTAPEIIDDIISARSPGRDVAL